MKYMFRLAAGLTVLLLPSSGAATDYGAVTAALPDEASECRYLATLCAQAMDAERSSLEYEAAAKRLGAQRDFDGGIAALNKAEAYNDIAINTRIGMREAIEVVGAKHGRIPACYQPCPLLKK